MTITITFSTLPSILPLVPISPMQYAPKKFRPSLSFVLCNCKIKTVPPSGATMSPQNLITALFLFCYHASRLTKPQLESIIFFHHSLAFHITFHCTNYLSVNIGDSLDYSIQQEPHSILSTTIEDFVTVFLCITQALPMHLPIKPVQHQSQDNITSCLPGALFPTLQF